MKFNFPFYLRVTGGYTTKYELGDVVQIKFRSLKEENVSLSPQVLEGTLVFGVVHIFTSFNDSFVHVTDLSGIRNHRRHERHEPSAYVAMLPAQDVAVHCKEVGITALHIKIRVTGGTSTKTPGPGGQNDLCSLTRVGISIDCIENITPVSIDCTCGKGSFRGHRL
ncbi:hypothetical protein MVEN_00910700 [Mycena venus]|uniref:Small ribosomal subunit protein uS11 n=1 Tax=Mycena venus TaxID=2733690 RepID=A0A8H7CZC8_9AGAR|nr:hypothetical protein MVEN_00910700 [Mycena venus]